MVGKEFLSTARNCVFDNLALFNATGQHKLHRLSCCILNTIGKKNEAFDAAFYSTRREKHQKDSCQYKEVLLAVF